MVMAASGQIGIYTDPVIGGKAATMHVDTSSILDVRGRLNVASGQLNLPGSLGIGYVDLGPHLFAARNSASSELIASGSSAPSAFWGGLLMPDGNPSLNQLSTANPQMRIQWASAQVAAIVLPPIAIPNDLSTAGGLTVQLFGETVGTASAADAIQAVQIIARSDPLSSASNADQGATIPSFTSTPGWQGLTLASGTLTTNVLTIMLVPQAHAARAINVYGARLSYSKKTS